MEWGSVVFSAGRGKRLRPLTDRIPKPVLPVLDVPLAAWGLAACVRAHPPVVVNASHLASKVGSGLEPLALERWEAFVEVPEGFGTAGTLRALVDRLASTVLTHNGDLLTSLKPEELLGVHENHGVQGTIAVRRVASKADVVGEDGRVTRFIDRRRDPTKSGYQFLGMAAIEKDAIARLPETRPLGLGETLLKELAESQQLAYYPFDGYARDVGTFESYLRANLDVLGGVAPSPPVATGGEIANVDGGRAYVGAGARVERSSLGPGAVVMTGARIGAGARIAHSVVLPGEIVPAGSLLEGAVWAQGTLCAAPGPNV